MMESASAGVPDPVSRQHVSYMPSTSSASIEQNSLSQPSADIEMSEIQTQQGLPVDTEISEIQPQHHEPVLPAVVPRMNRPCEDLITGPKEDYLRIGVPLYEASLKGDWKAAKVILDGNKERKLVRHSITENGETALHIAASAKGSKKVDEFVRNLVKEMEKEDLELLNKNQNTALYLAAAAGNLETVEIMMAKNSILLIIPGGGGRMMPLYAAVLFGHKDVVEHLYKHSYDLCDDGWNTTNRGWLLEKCVESDMFDVALNIVKKFPKIGMKSSILGVLARKPEAFCEKKRSVSSYFHLKEGGPEHETDALELLRSVWRQIVELPNKEIDDILRGPPNSVKSDSGRVIHTLRLETLLDEFDYEVLISPENVMELRNIVSKHLRDMHDEIQALINKTASGKGDQILELQKLISEYIVKIGDEYKSLLKSEPTELAQKRSLICEHIDKVRRDLKPKPKHSSRVLFVAAEAGNTNFLVELIRLRPDLMWKVDDNNQTIFHIAVKHRHQGIYNLLYEIGSMKDMITPLRDAQGNNMLHFVGMIAKPKRLEEVSGPALKLQRELLWFQKVQDTIPPSYKDRKNEDDLTPHELFTKEHEDLVAQGEKWMKGAANQGMVVAALIATIVFAAAFTVPGGYAQSDEKKTNHKIGVPVFHSNTIFILFVVADAISLFASSASIFIFLSIRMSRYAECDFLESIPNKLIAGLTTLFIAIATMTLTFGVSFFVLYKKGLLWIPIVIGIFGFLPVILYMCLQFRLFSDIIRSIFVSKYLFKSKKHVLNYGNPKV